MAKKVTVDPQKLKDASQKIDEESRQYESDYKQLFTEVNSMGAAWKGTDNTAYVQRIKDFEEDFKLMVKVINEYSRFLSFSADQYTKLQNEIESAANKLVN